MACITEAALSTKPCGVPALAPLPRPCIFPPAPMALTPEQWLSQQACLANDQAARNAFLRAAPWVQQLVVARGNIERAAQLVGRIQKIGRENPKAALGPGGQSWSRVGEWRQKGSGKGKRGTQRSRSPVPPRMPPPPVVPPPVPPPRVMPPPVPPH